MLALFFSCLTEFTRCKLEIPTQRPSMCWLPDRAVLAATIAPMNFQRILVPVLAIAALVLAYVYYQWMGLAAAAAMLVMWLMLHFTRLMHILQRAAKRPIGYVDSAVMLNAKLKPGMTLMHVVAMTRALGQLRSDKDAQPELYRWTDNSDSHVDCTFVGGKLTQHSLFRPPPPAAEGEPPATA